jgi:predicted type IV restriction endonuclease
MLSASPLVSLYQVIQQVRLNAAANTGIFQKNEAATRAALIDPILRGPGWDTANVRMVEPERTVENKQALD